MFCNKYLFNKVNYIDLLNEYLKTIIYCQNKNFKQLYLDKCYFKNIKSGKVAGYLYLNKKEKQLNQVLNMKLQIK